MSHSSVHLHCICTLIWGYERHVLFCLNVLTLIHGRRYVTTFGIIHLEVLVVNIGWTGILTGRYYTVRAITNTPARYRSSNLVWKLIYPFNCCYAVQIYGTRSCKKTNLTKFQIKNNKFNDRFETSIKMCDLLEQYLSTLELSTLRWLSTHNNTLQVLQRTVLDSAPPKTDPVGSGYIYSYTNEWNRWLKTKVYDSRSICHNIFICFHGI